MGRKLTTLVLALMAASLSIGCDLFMKQLSKGPEPPEDTDDADSGPDGGVDWCPGYEGENECCALDDPCGWAGDEFCDCDGFCDWDDADCGGDTDTGTDTGTGTDEDGGASDAGVWCVGYTGDDPCCQIDNPCDWAGDDVCDCDETCDWDWEDCQPE